MLINKKGRHFNFTSVDFIKVDNEKVLLASKKLYNVSGCGRRERKTLSPHTK